MQWPHFCYHGAHGARVVTTGGTLACLLACWVCAGLCLSSAAPAGSASTLAPWPCCPQRQGRVLLRAGRRRKSRSSSWTARGSLTGMRSRSAKPLLFPSVLHLVPGWQAIYPQLGAQQALAASTYASAVPKGTGQCSMCTPQLSQV